MNGIQGPDSVKQERLTVLIRRYEKDILRICYLYLHDTEQARDTVQETFLKARKKAGCSGLRSISAGITCVARG